MAFQNIVKVQRMHRKNVLCKHFIWHVVGVRVSLKVLSMASFVASVGAIDQSSCWVDTEKLGPCIAQRSLLS